MSDGPERVIVDALAGSRQYLAELGHSYAGKWLDANARHFIAKRALDALEEAGYEVVPCWNQQPSQPPTSGLDCNDPTARVGPDPEELDRRERERGIWKVYFL